MRSSAFSRGVCALLALSLATGSLAGCQLLSPEQADQARRARLHGPPLVEAELVAMYRDPTTRDQIGMEAQLRGLASPWDPALRQRLAGQGLDPGTLDRLEAIAADPDPLGTRRRQADLPLVVAGVALVAAIGTGVGLLIAELVDDSDHYYYESSHGHSTLIVEGHD